MESYIVNQKQLFNDGWMFAKSDLFQIHPINLDFSVIDIPHDWLIHNTQQLYENSIGWYKKNFINPNVKQTFVYFEGVYMDTEVYVNQQLVGEWKYGYSSFEFNISDYLVAGENEILVKVVHQSPNSRWYSGAGIYRNVWLITRADQYIPTNGIYVSSKKRDHDWVLAIETTLCINTNVQITHTLFYEDEIIAYSTVQATPELQNPLKTELIVKNPHLWSPDTPYLYTITTKMTNLSDTLENKEVFEKITTQIGFREIQFDPNDGLFLNGKPLKLQGVCEHHDLGALGAAFNREALKRRLILLKELGVNAIRVAHNMPAPDFMDLTDELGFLVISEAFDMWALPKTKFDYARFFSHWYKKDVKSWVERDRNHPSLMLWSIGNEIYDTHVNDKGSIITQQLMEQVWLYDPYHNAQVTLCSNYMPWEHAQKCADIVKIVGYNYGEKYYRQHHDQHPDWVIYGSETSSIVQSRGIYHFPLEASILADDDEQCSSLGNSSTSWGARSYEQCIITEQTTPFSLGQFLWTGFDYLGEPTPYHTKNSYFGMLDTATFKKDAFYLYQSVWTSYKTNPMIHIIPLYWDFNPGQIIDVRVCSNAPYYELYFNDEIVESYHSESAPKNSLFGWWKIPYTPGELKAIAYDHDGNIIATCIRKSFLDAHEIQLVPDRLSLRANGTDLLFLEINVLDILGNPVGNATNRIQIKVTGNGRLIGIDNGDSTDYDQFKGTSKRLFSGKLMAIIASTLHPGTIEVDVSSIGIVGKKLSLQSLPVRQESLRGISAIEKNDYLHILTGSMDEIPVRKIEILCPSGTTLNLSKQELILHAHIKPENATYQDIEWSVVNLAGIPINLAKIEPLEHNMHNARLTAYGDGSFRVRCTSKNGTNKIRLISEIECSAEGFGTAFKNPFQFISAGLYDFHEGEITNGNEKGVATSRDSQSLFGFDNLDFGTDGSDIITIPIFALSNEPYPLEIWGKNHDGLQNELIATVIYQKESKWNVYQAETYKLEKRLRGIYSIFFVTHKKMHIKGFIFERQNRTLSRIYATECDRIYGDTFQISDKCVKNIGNNVSLEFHSLHFTSKSVNRLLIYGRSPQERNTIHIQFSNEQELKNLTIEFLYSEEYSLKEFPIDTVMGIYHVTFLFLPGSNFDFGWFQFQ
jgi:beta-galactosidase